MKGILDRWWISGIALCAAATTGYVWMMRPYALQVFSTVGPLQDSKAGGNVQGLFTYHAVVIAVFTLIVVLATAVAAVVQLVQIRKDRDLDVAVGILKYHEDPCLFRLRGFINQHMEEINKLLPESPPKVTVNAKIKELSGNRWELEDIYRLVSILNHTCLFISKGFISTDIALEFYPVITRMWVLLASLVFYERQNRAQRSGLNGEWYSDHFERVACKMLSPEYAMKVRKRLGLPKSQSAGAMYFASRDSFATKPELGKAFTEIASLRDELQELQNRIPKPSV
jgi:hypothetical protein